MPERHDIEVDGAVLRGERWAGGPTPVVLLHAGVCDRRSWYEVAPQLTSRATVVAHDRRGFGETPLGDPGFRHVDDLLAVLRTLDVPAWLVGSSMGGGVAVDAALLAPDLVAGLVLLAPAVTGAPPVGELDPATARLDAMIDEAFEAGDLERLNRLETWLWLDGPTVPEGRVAGPARELALAMNAIVLQMGDEDHGGSGLDAWQAWEGLTLPVTLAVGDLDVGFLVDRCRSLAQRLPHVRWVDLPGRGHLPYLEDPAQTARIVLDALP